MTDLEEVTMKLIQVAMEKRLRRTLVEVAPELPPEVLDELYSSLFKPVMVLTMIRLMEVIPWQR